MRKLIYSNYNQPTTLTSLSNNIDDDQLDPLCVDIESFKINHKLTNTEVLLAMIEVCSDQHYYNISECILAKSCKDGVFR